MRFLLRLGERAAPREPHRNEIRMRASMPVGDQHHGPVAVAMAVLPGDSDQAGNLAIGEVLAFAELGIRLAAWRLQGHSAGID